MSDDRPIEKPLIPSRQIVKQMSINPDVLSEPAVPCVAGPCDGQMMRCPADRILIVINAIDGMRGVSLPPDLLQLSKDLGGYAGHYERTGDRLTWIAG